jgi:hypothetical protein
MRVLAAMFLEKKYVLAINYCGSECKCLFLFILLDCVLVEINEWDLLLLLCYARLFFSRIISEGTGF